MKVPVSQNQSPKDPLEGMVTSALEQQPAPQIPGDFAARVTARAMAIPHRSRTSRAHYARAVSLFWSGILLVALFVLAPRAQPTFTSASFDLELTMIVLLAAMVYFLRPFSKGSL